MRYASIAALDKPLSEGEEVWLSDGELRIRATVSRDGKGWAARADWTSFV